MIRKKTTCRFFFLPPKTLFFLNQKISHFYMLRVGEKMQWIYKKKKYIENVCKNGDHYFSIFMPHLKKREFIQVGEKIGFTFFFFRSFPMLHWVAEWMSHNKAYTLAIQTYKVYNKIPSFIFLFYIPSPILVNFFSRTLPFGKKCWLVALESWKKKFFFLQQKKRIIDEVLLLRYGTSVKMLQIKLDIFFYVAFHEQKIYICALFLLWSKLVQK